MLYYPLYQEESFNFLPSGTNCGLKGIVKKSIESAKEGSQQARDVFKTSFLGLFYDFRSRDVNQIPLRSLTKRND